MRGLVRYRSKQPMRRACGICRIGIAVALIVTGAAACSGGSPAPVDTTVAVPAPVASASPPATSAEQTKAVLPGDDLTTFFGNGFTLLQRGSFGFDRAHVLPATDPVLGRTLRVSYPAGSASNSSANTDGSAYGGAQVYLRPSIGPVDQVHLRYYVRFQPGFDFVKGGKLPGLYGGTVISGGHIPDGTNGFSTRYMWRRSGAGEVYAYLPSSVAHGTSLGRGAWSFTQGQWICIEQAVQLNTPGRADGSVSVWLDGKLVFTQPDMSYRTTDNLKIDGLFFSTFFGGGDPSWASPTDQYADFAAFVVSKQLIGPLPHPPN